MKAVAESTTNNSFWSDRRKGLVAAIMTATCWSFLALFLKFALIYANSYTIVWYRMLVAFFLLLGWFIYTGKTKDLSVFLVKPGLILVAALALSFNYVGFMQGVNYASPASAQVFIQVGPLLLALSGLYFFKEKLSASQLLGLGFCVAGFGLFFWDRMSFSQNNSANFFLGLFWVLAGAVTWALFASLQKYLLRTWNSSQLNIYIYLVASLVFIPFVDWQALADLPITIHGFYIFLGFNTLLAYGCLAIALKYLPATQVSPIITMNPLLTLVLIASMEALNWQIIPADPIGLVGYIGAITAVSGIVMVLNKKPQTKV